MNKTVNINLAGISFHLDENAYGKLSRYLDAIRRSLKQGEGRGEIMQDIEARIAELFSEKIEFQSQVIGLKELDEVIAVMGQPEDYQVDDEIFDDSSSTSHSHSRTKTGQVRKQLFRDIDDKYIGGVSSGLGHYIGIDALWIRLLWVILVLAGLGSPILVYILMWILVPAAETTSEKLKMTGEPINISNIERKFKEGFDNVAEKVKNVNYDKYGNKIKTGASSFFDTLGEFFVAIFKVFSKVIGILIIIISSSTIIGLTIGFFALGSMDFWGNHEMAEYIGLMDSTNMPVWLWALLGLLAIGIPFFVLFILGLKLLISNLRPIGYTVKIVLVVLWALSIIGLIFLGIQQATEQSYNGNSITEKALNLRPSDSLQVMMRADLQYDYRLGRNSDLEVKYTADNKKLIYSKNIRINLNSTMDSIGKIIVEKSAEGTNSLEAKKRAEAIEYNYSFNDNKLDLDGFFTTDIKNKFRGQKIEISVFVPEGTVFYTDDNVDSYYGFNSNLKGFPNRSEGYYFRILKNKVECLDCNDKKQTIKLRDTVYKDTINKDKVYENEPVDTLTPVKTKSWEDEVLDDFRD